MNHLELLKIDKIDLKKYLLKRILLLGKKQDQLNKPSAMPVATSSNS